MRTLPGALPVIEPLAEILVATDLSRPSEHAYPYAAGIALAFGSRVTLLHVDEVSPLLRPSEETNGYLTELSARRRTLLEAARKVFEGWGITARVETCKGKASRRILSTAKRINAGLVVMSKSGGRVFEQLLFGSTTKRVLRSTRVPLLVVHQPRSQGPLRDAPVSYRRLLAPTDLEGNCERPVALAVALSQRLGSSEVLLTHVVRLPQQGVADHALTFPKGSLEPARHDAALALRRLAERFDAELVDPRVLVGEAVAQTLAEMANAESVDLVVLASHAQPPDGTSIGHTAEALLRRVTRPVLVLPWSYVQGTD